MKDADYQRIYDRVDKELVTPSLRRDLATLTMCAGEPAIAELTKQLDQLRARLVEVERERDDARAMVGAELMGLENEKREAIRRWQKVTVLLAEACGIAKSWMPCVQVMNDECDEFLAAEKRLDEIRKEANLDAVR